MIAEIFPRGGRGRAMSVATIANWGCSLLIAPSFLAPIRLVGPTRQPAQEAVS